MNNTTIIAIGSSAGGLVALKSFFDAVIHDKVSYIVLRHIPKAFQSELQQILQRHSKLMVVEACDGMKVENDKVYISPAFAHMTIKNNTLYLHSRQEQPVANWAVNIFLTSLAAEINVQRIAIILSGSGTDGAKGITLLKQSGGMIVVQDPKSCEHASMPLNAIETGHVDHVMLPEQMPLFIQQFLKNMNDTVHYASKL